MEIKQTHGCNTDVDKMVLELFFFVFFFCVLSERKVVVFISPDVATMLHACVNGGVI